MNKIIACTFVACLLVVAYAGHNVANAAADIAQKQTGHQARLACAETPACNDPTGATK